MAVSCVILLRWLRRCLLPLLCLTTSVVAQSITNTGTLALNSTITGNATLQSPGGVFELGFTSGVQSNLTVYTLAIWYVQTPLPRQVVWVADRSMALQTTTAASFSLSAAGDLEVYDNSTIVWKSNTSNLNVVNAAMEDTGNLVLLNANNAVVWQSFDTPTDTLLPNQMLLENSTTAMLTAWEDLHDWRNGNYSLTWSSRSNLTLTYANPYGPYQHGQNLGHFVTNIAYWPPSAFTSPITYAVLQPDGDFRGINDVTGSNSTSITIGAASGNGISAQVYRLTLDIDGNLRMYSWYNGSSDWTFEWMALFDCNVEGYCGPYGICNGGVCTCPDQFVMVDSTDSRLGCRRTHPIASCGSQNEYNDTFLPALNADWAFNDLNYTPNVNVSTCQQLCLANCNCQAVVVNLPLDANNVTSNCYLKRFPLLNGANISGKASYFRVGENFPNPSQRRVNKLVIVASTVGTLVALSFGLGLFFLAQRRQIALKQRLEAKWVAPKGVMLRFTYPEIVLMTANFETQIGEGGFGTVFKGHVGENVTVAVKRLNKQLSTEVEKEFLNEVKSIGLIHHVNLVPLLGYCADGKHRLLVYEYVERGSLDRALYRKDVSHPVLEWRPRFAIAIQTARGLAYLHEDCKEQIIHCDVKPENILLDADLNAKVADFGISRIMKRGQASTKTVNIRGTKGYIGPEWMSDRWSITSKVDVYSFGMVLLEIISGRRNQAPDKEDSCDKYYPTWAYPMMETAEFMEVVDPALSTGTVDPDEVRRALRVAFWCINRRPKARPKMGEVVQMLQGHVPISLPVPKPDFVDIVEYHGEEEDGDRERGAIDDARGISEEQRPIRSWGGVHTC